MSSHPQSAERVRQHTLTSSRKTAALAFGLAATLLAAGCSSLGGGASVDYDPTLVNGQRAFGEEVSASEADDANLVLVSDDMKAYLDANVGERRLSVARFKKLFHSLSRDGYFSSTYDADKTYNAADTFSYKAGNCLSYTNMFLAMARETGLHAYYQIVRVPPSWDADSGYLIRYTHINVLVKGVKLDKFGGGEFTVDFNSVHPEPDYHRKTVSDQYAESLFHANRSVNLIRAGQPREGFANLRRAIELVPNNPDLWINLGAFYGKRGQYQAAIDTYNVALNIDSGNKGAISGLSRAYANLGNEEQAQYYAESGEALPREKRLLSLCAGAGAVRTRQLRWRARRDQYRHRLKRRNGRFYFMRGLAEQKLGDMQAAKKSFRRAERLGSFRDLKLRYVNEFAGVVPHAPPGCPQPALPSNVATARSSAMRQIFHPHRLGNEVVHARVEAGLAIARHRVGRHRDDVGLLNAFLDPDTARGFQAVEFRHLHVHEHQVIVLLRQHVHGFPAVAGHVRLQAHFLQHLQRDLLIHRIVFGNQYTKSRIARILLAVVAGRSGRIGCFLVEQLCYLAVERRRSDWSPQRDWLLAEVDLSLPVVSSTQGICELGGNDSAVVIRRSSVFD